MKLELDDMLSGRKLRMQQDRANEHGAVKQFLDCLAVPSVTKTCYYQERVASGSKLLTFATLTSVLESSMDASGRVPLSLAHHVFKDIDRKLPLNVLLNLQKARRAFNDVFVFMQDRETPHGAVFKWPYHGYYVLHNWEQRIFDADSKIVNTLPKGVQLIIEPWEPLAHAIVRKIKREKSARGR